MFRLSYIAHSFEMVKPKAIIVIPCYNEASRFQTETFVNYYNTSECSFCFINDGSKDNTAQLITDIQSGRENRIHFINRKENLGKAESVREGMLKCLELDYDWIGFLDADFATPLTEIDYLLDFGLANSDFKVLIGSRFKRLGGNIERKFFRFVLGRAFATVTANLLKLPVYDTQCGAKLFKKEVVQNIFDQPFISQWLFDIELLYRYKIHFGIKKTLVEVVECPLREWKEIPGSKLRFKDFLILPFQLLKLNKFYKTFKTAPNG